MFLNLRTGVKILNTLNNIENLKIAVKNSYNFSQVLRLLGLTTNGDNRKTLRKRIFENNIDISHFISYNKDAKTKKPIEYYLVKNSNSSRSNIKNRLLKERIKENKCELCGQEAIWNGKLLIMILDHINGVNNDYRLENLRMVCPNCNSQLKTTAGRNKKFLSHCICGKPIRYSSSRYCNKNCVFKKQSLKNHNKEMRKVERPSYEELKEELKKSNFLAMSRKYGVSDNAIRKWFKYYEKYS